VIGSIKNVTRVRKAIPIAQPGDSRYADSAGQFGKATASARPRKANSIFQRGPLRFATIFFSSRAENK
jgi:hypothetical protein